MARNTEERSFQSGVIPRDRPPLGEKFSEVGPVERRSPEEMAKAEAVCDSYNWLGGNTEDERVEWLSEILHMLGTR